MRSIELQYVGMSYEQASREAERVIKSRGGWFANFDRLQILHRIMCEHDERIARAMTK